MNTKDKPAVLFLLLSVYLLPCQSQYTPEYVPQGKEPPKGPPQPFPYALSSTYLTYLARTEVEIQKEMVKYAQALQERLGMIHAYLQDYEDSSIRGTAHMPEDVDPWQRATQIAAHPITAYRMVRRFATEFDAIGSHVSQQLERQLEERVNKLSGVFPWPSEKDLGDAMDAILRVHYVYNLNLEEFARGNIMGIQTDVGFTPSQSFKIAEYAAKNEYYSLALDWLRLTESRMKEENDTMSVSGFSIANTYKRNIEKHDRDFDRNKHNSHLYMFTERLSENPNAPTLRSVNYEKMKGMSKDEHPEAGHYNFLALCNGEDFQDPRYKATLKCWYDKRNPYFYLFPLKAELLNREPLLIQFHDIINEAWTREMKKAAMPTLQRAPQNVPGATPRTAVYAWLEDEHIPNSPIGRRIELITGLHVRGMNASEALQIASYAYGGHVSTHFDSLGGNPDKDPILKLKGDRVTTFLVYLNECQKGGLTAFPVLGTHVQPVKGSAVLWYTSLKNGQIDMRMLHGACPIVLGHKWIATKWTHLNQNFLTRPCDLNPDM
ncbi:Prolyl 4-hydroxylase subunit alpha-2 [Orchesella cincta]|uniref:procollagen-proline 4-dioxygenase n=1 Tax=Orchesella cincta TaxID=48709 RepID=A0A1D2NET6_ORCCI|nr:Prolyl 4-hydroxylase subunit alpha-2 [Orchesella cincta]